MHSNILCRERLNRLLRVLRKLEGVATIRDLQRTHGIWQWEVGQAEELGWLRVTMRKNARGPASQVAEIISNSLSAKCPPFRNGIPREIRFKHRMFAINSVMPIDAPGPFRIRMPSKTDAYLMTYRDCRDRNAAAVGACRLMKRTDVKLMRTWLFCEVNHEIVDPMPWTIEDLLAGLEPLGKIRYVRRRS